MAHAHNRRDFIKFLAAGAATTTLASCATTSQVQKPIGRVIVIGAGYGGAAAAKYIRMWSGGRIEVFLIDRETQFVSCPMSNLVLGGSKKIEDISVSYAGLREYGVQVLRDEVTAIDTAKKMVKLTRIQDLPYDRLVLSPGIDFMYDLIPGLNNAEAQKTVHHAWKAGPETVALRKQLEAMRDGGVFVLSVPKAPYRCPPGPYERACQVASYFKQAKPKSKILILDANPDIVSKKGLFLKAWGDHYKGMIDYHHTQEAKDVDLRGMAVKTDFDSFKGDVLNVIPQQKAAGIAASAGVINANNRWCNVDWLTMQSTANPDIHVLGDATLSAPAMPKSGAMANQHAKVCAAGVVALMTGQAVNQAPMMINTCYSFVSDKEAVHVASVHSYDAKDKTFKTVPGSGGLSTAASELEGIYGWAWAQNIWADTLG
ncbi:MAG: twin-arginine translocation signal domain-containing protein [Betaproteobacteria bacterium]|nr:MAG: twin-arginine translocation signal domain-containing protein [Betaproteobacteria bacterium]